ncbi:MAG: STAS domain-containing protein [Planctomycetaceae bacterium]|nr:STAS domain-containing protein [Planctomycetaceae bacterium]
MELTVQSIGDVTIVDLGVEELDAGNTVPLKEYVAPVLDVHFKVVLDLNRMRFVDSSGLGFFLSCLRKVKAAGGDLKLCGMSKPVRAVFELVKMHRILEIHSTREEAVRAFHSDPSDRIDSNRHSANQNP